MITKELKFSEYYNDIILEEIEKMYDVSRDKIFLGSRKKNIIYAKRMYIYVIREVFSLTVTEIAELSNLHHASVIHHTRQFEFFYNNYVKDSDDYKRVENRIKEVEVDEEIQGLEKQLKTIKQTLTELYNIKKIKDEREKRESLLTE
tara:strand:+ start:1823 stop:2263 length:441 start_codon:yes stop_codon:yes gene_type:complete